LNLMSEAVRPNPKYFYIQKGMSGLGNGTHKNIWLSGYTTDENQMYDSMLVKVNLWHPQKTPPNVGAIAIKRIVCKGNKCSVYKRAHCIVCPRIITPTCKGHKKCSESSIRWNYDAPATWEQNNGKSSDKRTREYIQQQKSMMQMETEEENKAYIPYPFESPYPAHITATERKNFGKCLEYLYHNGSLFTKQNGTNVVSEQYSCPTVMKRSGGAIKFDYGDGTGMRRVGSSAWWATQRDMIGF